MHNLYMAASINSISNRVIIPKTCRERFLPLNTAVFESLRRRGVESAGVSDLRAPYCIGRVLPRYHVAFFTLGGKAAWRGEHSSGTLRAGDFWFGPAEHSYEYKASPRWQVAWFHLQQRAANWTEGFVTRRTEVGSQIQSCMFGLLAETSGRVGESYAEVLGLLLERELSSGAEADPRAAQWAALWQAIDESLRHPWRVEEMAARVHVSVVQFFRINKRLYGSAPLALLNQRRMERGAQMLQQTDYKMEQIAHLVGYSTAFAFSKAFKRHWDISPQGYRKSRLHR
jgi:AraC-like DNA-binding protein